MGKIKTVELNSAQRIALEKGYRAGESHAFRLRCQMILLKSEQRTAIDIADLLGCCEVVVNNWLKRFDFLPLSTHYGPHPSFLACAPTPSNLKAAMLTTHRRLIPLAMRGANKVQSSRASFTIMYACPLECYDRIALFR